MTLKERLEAKESKFGTMLKTWVTYLFATIAALGATLEFAQLIPHDWIPQWLKVTIVIAALVSRVAGKLTVDEKVIKEQKEKQHE
jgi:hypothetical protein